MDSTGKLVMESILETEAATLLQFFAGLRGTLAVTFEEGAWAAWLYDLLKPHVDRLVVCNPRKNALLKDGNKSDRIEPSGWQKSPEAGVRRRAERLYEQLDMLRHLHQQARRELLAESRKHAITAKLRQIPYLGPMRSALAVALIQTPNRVQNFHHT